MKKLANSKSIKLFIKEVIEKLISWKFLTIFFLFNIIFIILYLGFTGHLGNPYIIYCDLNSGKLKKEIYFLGIKIKESEETTELSRILFKFNIAKEPSDWYNIYQRTYRILDNSNISTRFDKILNTCEQIILQLYLLEDEGIIIEDVIKIKLLQKISGELKKHDAESLKIAYNMLQFMTLGSVLKDSLYNKGIEKFVNGENKYPKNLEELIPKYIYSDDIEDKNKEKYFEYLFVQKVDIHDGIMLLFSKNEDVLGNRFILYTGGKIIYKGNETFKDELKKMLADENKQYYSEKALMKIEEYLGEPGQVRRAKVR